MKRYTILVAILALAIAFYMAGLVTGAMALFAAGALFEGAFWISVMRKPRPVRVVARRTERRLR
ncbi:hypothetical protein KPL74_03370 [Bacillus sp. NP157]|nr:hypothetical protein KPL74_03370 [Bacillus sp. NP157]